MTNHIKVVDFAKNGLNSVPNSLSFNVSSGLGAAKLTEFTKDNPCDICKSCRQCKYRKEGDKKFILCHQEQGDVSGYTYKGRSSNGEWGIYIEGEGESPESKAARSKKQKTDLEKLNQEILNTRSINARDRDLEFAWKNYGLNEVDKQLLLDRGLTQEQIIELRCYSDLNGFVIPIHYKGSKVGAQVRRRSPGPDESRYYWHGYGRKELRETMELPMAVFAPEGKCKGVLLVEGAGIKPFIAASKFRNYLVIGAVGGQHLASFRTLNTIIDEDEYKNLPIYIVPDAGDILNPQVMATIKAKDLALKAIGRQPNIWWWSQFTKQDSDIDEIAGTENIQEISFQAFSQIAMPLEKIFSQYAAKIMSFSADAASTVKGLLGKFNPDFKVSSNITFYKNIEDLKRILLDPSNKFILDISETGSGKSTGVVHLARELMSDESSQFGRFYLASQSYRRATTPDAEETFSPLPTRHPGLAIDPIRKTPKGKQELSRVSEKNKDWERTLPNCHKADFFSEMRRKGVDSSEVKVCGACHLQKQCSMGSGDGYGYIHERRLAASLRSLSCTLSAVPTTQDHSSDILFVDDYMIAHSREINISREQYDQMMQLLSSTPEGRVFLERLGCVFDRIGQAFAVPAFYGHQHSDIFDSAFIPTIADVLEATRLTLPNVGDLLSSRPEPPIFQSYDSANRRAQLQSEYEAALKEAAALDLSALQSIQGDWLVQLIQGLSSPGSGYVSINNESMKLLIFDSHEINTVKSFGKTILLNATIDPEYLARVLGIDIAEIKIISKEKTAVKNLTVTQVMGVGSPSARRGEEQIRRLDILTKGLSKVHGADEFAVFDSSKHLRDEDGYEHKGVYWRDTVGSNRFEKAKAMFMRGQMVKNIGALAAEYSLMMGELHSPTSNDEGLVRYIQHHQAADVVQAIGRLRANRRLDENLFVYICTEREDFPINQIMGHLPGAQLEVKHAIDIDEKTAPASKQLCMEIFNILEILVRAGGEYLTQATLQAKLAAKGIQTEISNISKIFKKMGGNYRDAFDSLIKIIASSIEDGREFTNKERSDFQSIFAPEAVACVQSRMDDKELPQAQKEEEVMSWVMAYNSQEWTALIAQLRPETGDDIRSIVTKALAQDCQKWVNNNRHILDADYEPSIELLTGRLAREVRWGIRHALWSGTKTLTDFRLRSIEHMKYWDSAYNQISEHSIYFNKRLANAMRGNESDLNWLLGIAKEIGC